MERKRRIESRGRRNSFYPEDAGESHRARDTGMAYKSKMWIFPKGFLKDDSPAGPRRQCQASGALKVMLIYCSYSFFIINCCRTTINSY